MAAAPHFLVDSGPFFENTLQSKVRATFPSISESPTCTRKRGESKCLLPMGIDLQRQSDHTS